MIARILRWFDARKADRIRREMREAAQRTLPELMARQRARDAQARSDRTRRGNATRKARAGA